jgi:hypothetical protein
MFERMNLENVKTRVGEDTPATVATPATRNEDLFEYLLDSITTGEAYATLWPNVRTYCMGQMPAEHFSQLDQAAAYPRWRVPPASD